MQRFSRTIIRIIIISTFFAVLAIADDSTKKLDKVLSQINQVKADLNQSKKKYSSIKQELVSLRQEVLVLERRIAKTSRELSAQKKILSSLNRDRSRQQSKLEDAKEDLLSQIVLAYQLEKKNYLKSLFKRYRKKTPDLLLAYHEYIFSERINQMRNLKKIIDGLEVNRKKIDRETRRLKSLEIQQFRNKQALEKNKVAQKKILDSLGSKIVTQSRKLKKLLLAKKNLEKLVNKISFRNAIKMNEEEKVIFCENFVWPTKGVIVTHFGSSIEDSTWTWNGVIINAPFGQDVRAALGGKVIYADRLSGYGLLLIIDHGNGYMSLYGHNSSLHKGLDHKVEAGEIISKVGQSDAENTQLYFAIRYNGESIDPERWCRRD